MGIDGWHSTPLISPVFGLSGQRSREVGVSIGGRDHCSVWVVGDERRPDRYREDLKEGMWGAKQRCNGLSDEYTI